MTCPFRLTLKWEDLSNQGTSLNHLKVASVVNWVVNVNVGPGLTLSLVALMNYIGVGE
jgi:hypothetical protein